MARIDLRARLAQPEPFLFAWASMPGAVYAEEIARLPFEGVCIDLQHGVITAPDMMVMIPAIVGRGKPAIARLLWNDSGLIGQALDAGADVVIAPMVDTRADAEKLIKASKYPPLGSRSWGGYAASRASGMTAKDYLAKANQLTMAMAMIETQEALDNLDEIASTPGLDGLFVGPNDLAISLARGVGDGPLGAQAQAAMKKIVAAANKHKLVPGIFGGSVEFIKTFSGLGFKFISGGFDLGMMQAGAAQLLAGLKA